MIILNLCDLYSNCNLKRQKQWTLTQYMESTTAALERGLTREQLRLSMKTTIMDSSGEASLYRMGRDR